MNVDFATAFVFGSEVDGKSYIASNFIINNIFKYLNIVY